MAEFNPVPWSYSALKKYENCPRQYSEIVVHKNYKDEFTSPKGDYGDRLHKAAEAYVCSAAVLADEFGFLKEVLDVLVALPGEKRAEHKMGVHPDGTAARWNDPERWFQGIADLTIIHPEKTTAYVADYKTGDAKYADTDQLELMSMLIFAHYPHVQRVKGMLLFVLSQQPRYRTVERGENDRLWQKYRERDARRIASYHANNWPARESGLCRKHCIVDSCEHWGGGKTIARR